MLLQPSRMGHLYAVKPGEQMAVFGYGRVSTKEQQSQNQRLALQRAGFDVSYWFADEGVSGKVPALQRAQFRILLEKYATA